MYILLTEDFLLRRYYMPEKLKTRIMDLMYDIVGSVFYSAGIYTFAKAADFAPGGVSGLSVIINHVWNIPIGLVTLALNIPLIILCFKTLGKSFILKTIRSMAIYIFLLDAIFPRTPVYTGDKLLAALFSGIFIGTGLALFYMRGSSAGGTDFLIMSIKTMRPYFSIGTIIAALDLIVILLGWFAFRNTNALLYGITASFVSSIVVDKIMYGLGAGKLLIIITNKSSEISECIGRICRRGSTIFPAKGSFTQSSRDVILCACSKSQVFTVKSSALNLDKNAFIMITETSEVFGQGFITEKSRL